MEGGRKKGMGQSVDQSVDQSVSQSTSAAWPCLTWREEEAELGERVQEREWGFFFILFLWFFVYIFSTLCCVKSIFF